MTKIVIASGFLTLNGIESMALPKLVRDGIQIVAEDALIVTLVGLVFLGTATLAGWSGKEIIQDYTPLILAMFSILVTVSALRLNIKEGRERARQERDQGVRPVLVAEAVTDELKDQYFGDVTYQYKECCLRGSGVSGELYVSLENVGLGVALNTHIFIRCADEEYYLAGYEVPKLAVNEKVYLKIKYLLDSDLEVVVTRSEDVFENHHYCLHGLNGNYFAPEQLIVGNHYVEFRSVRELEKVKESIKRGYLTQDDYAEYGYVEDRSFDLSDL